MGRKGSSRYGGVEGDESKKAGYREPKLASVLPEELKDHQTLKTRVTLVLVRLTTVTEFSLR